jgi:hypothetical protein
LGTEATRAAMPDSGRNAAKGKMADMACDYRGWGR